MSNCITVVVEDDAFRPELEYIFRYLLALNHLVCRLIPLTAYLPESNSPLLFYTNNPPEPKPASYVQITPATRLWRNYLKPSSLPNRPFPVHDGLPVIFSGNSGQVRQSPQQLTTDLDIVASAFFLLTRYEEQLIPARDRHGRFASRFSLLSESDWVRQPLVNDYARLLGQWLRFVFGLPTVDREVGKFSYLLTHDVDHLRLYRGIRGELRTLASMLVRRRSLPTTARLLSGKLRTSFGRQPDPYDTIDYLMDQSEKQGAVSSFFFLTGNVDSRDGSYPPESPPLKAAVGAILRRGHEIGLHGSYRSYDDAAELARQKLVLEQVANKPIQAVRQHYLRFQAPATWQAQVEAGFDCDLTLAYAEDIGFRAGVATPFAPFDLGRRQPIDLLEFSTTIMDVTLFEPHYLGLSVDEALRNCDGVIDRVKDVNGVLVLLWHNSSLTDILLPGWRHFYEELLSLVRSKGGTLMSISELSARWRLRLSRS